MKQLSILILISLSIFVQAQTPCENGEADGFPCNQMTLQSRVNAQELGGTEVNDIWGWVDSETGKEYALVGLSDGVSFVDVTSPTSPVVIGKLIETHDHGRVDEIQHGESAWRDIKVYADHAYIVSDLNAEHGMQVFDLTQLRNFDGSVFQTFEQTSRYAGIGSAHNMVINEETGFGYIVGISSGTSTCLGGGLHIVDLRDPANPTYVACFDNDGYTHDAQCVVYNGPDADYSGMEICFNSNEDTFTIVNTEDKTSMDMISRTSYTDAGYTHQGWLSEDQNYFFMNDEFDEGNNGYNARTLIWDVRDLDNPIHIGDFYNEVPSIDHNLYTHNGLIFESNYSSGLRVLDYERADQAQLREVAFFDTHPSKNNISSDGSWSNYPYFESGNIIVSDRANGLFVLKLDMIDPITAHPESVSDCSGTSQTFAVETNGDNLNYQWQIMEGVQFNDLAESSGVTGVNTKSISVGLNKNTVGNKYRVKITDDNQTIYYSFPAEMNYLNPPAPSFSSSREENTFTFTNTSENADTYLWDFGDGNTSTEENPVHEYTFGGTYPVSLTASNNCSSSSKIEEALIPLGISESNIKIFPNPASSIIQIAISKVTTFKIFDLAGNMKITGSITSDSDQINVSQLGSGVYLIQIEQDGARVTKKISVK